jgi:hypothetical protein
MYVKIILVKHTDLCVFQTRKGRPLSPVRRKLEIMWGSFATKFFSTKRVIASLGPSSTASVAPIWASFSAVVWVSITLHQNN